MRLFRKKLPHLKRKKIDVINKRFPFFKNTESETNSNIYNSIEFIFYYYLPSTCLYASVSKSIKISYASSTFLLFFKNNVTKYL